MAAFRLVGFQKGSAVLELEPVSRGGPSTTLSREEGRSLKAPPTVSGRLHAIDLEPDEIAVRTPQGIDWTCSYPEAFEPQVKALIDEIVVVEGRGEMKAPRTGSMEIEAIRRAFDHEQPALFSAERVGLEGLQEAQGISHPQGLGSVGDPGWRDDEAGVKFFDYLLGRA